VCWNACRAPSAVCGGSGSFVYRLGPAGQRLSASTWRPHIPGTLFVAHSLQVAELFALLMEADRADQVELLEAHAEPACWRRYSGGTLKPDSYLRLGVGDYEDSYFIEVDMGTEGSRALIGKLRQYVAYAANGREQAERGVFPKVLWTAPSEARAAIIRDCIERLPGGSQGLFAVAPFDRALCVLNGEADNNDLPKLATDVTK
jgi:hypothetical protein